MSTRSAKGGGGGGAGNAPPRFHVAPEQAALRAQLVHPDAARGKFGRTTTATATAEDDYPQDEPRGGGEVRMVKMTGRKDRHATHSPSPTTAMLEDDLIGGGDDDDDEDEDGGGGGSGTTTTATTRKARFPNKRNAQSVGRRKIHIEFIEDKPRRHVTFTKRKSGLMKKAYELSTLTGTDCLVVVVSESGLLYTFSTPALSGVTDHPRGREFLEAALRGEIRGDGTGDFDFVGAGGGGGGGGGGGDGGDATGGGSARGEKRRRGGTTTARGMSGEGDQRINEQEQQHQHHMGGISVGNAAASADNAFQTFTHPHSGTAGDDFQLDPALHGLDLPVPPLPYPHPSHPHAQQQQQQQQLFDFLNFGGASSNVGGGAPSQQQQQQQQGGEFGTATSMAPPHAYTTTATSFSPSSHSFFSPPSSLQPSSISNTASSMAAHQPSHDHDPHGRLFPLSGGAASTTSAATTALSDHLSFPSTSSGAVGSSLFEHGSLGFPLGAGGGGGGGTNPLPPPPLATTSFASTSTSSSAPPPPPPPPFSGAPSGPATDREAVARAHELATKSYRAALSAAEAYTSASPPPPAVGGSSSSSASSSSSSQATFSPNAGGEQEQLAGGGTKSDPNRGRGKTFPRFDQLDMNELMLVSGGGGGAPGPSSAGSGAAAATAGGRRKRSAGAMLLPLDASEMGWDRSSSSSATTITRRVRSRLGDEGAGDGDAEAAESTGQPQQQQGGDAHDGQEEGEEEEEEESAEERKFRWQKEARKALKDAQKNPTIPSFLRAHAYSHYSLRPYPPRFDASKPLYSLAGVDDAPAMMWASFARMCCRSGVEDKLEMVGAVQEFLSRWLPHEMLRNPSFHPSFLVPALSHARSGLLSLLDYLEAHSLLSSSESDRVSAVLSGQIRPQAGYEEVLGLGRERGERLYGQPVAVAAVSTAGGGGVEEGGMELEKSTRELGEAETGNGAEGPGGEQGGGGEQQQQQPVAQERVEATG